MQNASKAYKTSMKGMLRNRGYIKASIGVVNSRASKYISVDETDNPITYFSDVTSALGTGTVEKVYATGEQDFSKVDGTMYFLPEEDEGYSYYNNGIVSESLFGSVCIRFGGESTYNLSGLQIEFGEYYPTEFMIQTDNAVFTFENDSSFFETDTNFNNVTYLLITPLSIVNGYGRLRIYSISCGMTNIFFNDEVLSFYAKEYVSSVTDSISSVDMTLKVDNRDLYYSPDNPESTLAYFEVGQDITIQFGYDVLGDGVIEWLPEITYHLKTWEANESEATFTATEKFDYMSGTYYGGLYREEGITLYNLALDVLQDAGVDEGDYSIDPYLKQITVYNPMPAVAHTEALQIIANAGRCVLKETRDGKICLVSSFVPDVSISVNNETEYSHIESVLNGETKDAYAIASNDFSVVDGSLYFMTDDESYLNTGYISESIADEDGNFDVNPVITLSLEAEFVLYGLSIEFREVAPVEFVVRTYYEGTAVDEITVTDPELLCVMNDRFETFASMEIEFTKGYPNSRVTIDNIVLGNVTDYVLTRDESLTAAPVATRERSLKSISVVMSAYSETNNEIKQLISKSAVISADDPTCVVYFSNASYGFIATTETSGVTVEITDSSSYFATLTFSGLTADTTVSYTVSGYEYSVVSTKLTEKYDDSGEEIEWSNPLISYESIASDLLEWLSSYYLGQVSYEISWRGDPRVDANDLFYLELKDGSQTLIRTYQNELNFSGAWSGTMKARRAVL